ncbi:MAG TPA: methionyl-tRNA formyltransferase [Arcobacter sp.]|nr:methionyl-tRNA formyltransferase [Arcobacter sp.]
MDKKIVFMGTPDYATVIFEKLIEQNYDIVALFTQPDKKVGRKQVLTPPHIKQFCIDKELDIPIYQPNKLRDDENIGVLKELQPDFIIVAAYGQILPKSILDIAPCINLHASLLPLYRGASPIQEALLNGDKFTGVTSMLMDVGLDSGDILGLEYLELSPDMCVEEVFAKLSVIAANLTINTLERFERIKPKVQNTSQVSHCGKISKEDGLVNLSDAKKVYNKYKAYHYWPGVFLESGLKLKDLKLIEGDSTNVTGEILQIEKEYIIVGCKKGTLQINRVQAPSKKEVSVIDYLHGNRLGLKDILE